MSKYRIVEDNGVFTPQVRYLIFYASFEKFSYPIPCSIPIWCASYAEALKVIDRDKAIKNKVIHKVE